MLERHHRYDREQLERLKHNTQKRRIKTSLKFRYEGLEMMRVRLETGPHLCLRSAERVIPKRVRSVAVRGRDRRLEGGATVVNIMAHR